MYRYLVIEQAREYLSINAEVCLLQIRGNFLHDPGLTFAYVGNGTTNTHLFIRYFTKFSHLILVCKTNEMFTLCGTPCSETCEGQEGQQCPDVCQVGCFCKQGFVRNSAGNCVPAATCAISKSLPL